MIPGKLASGRGDHLAGRKKRIPLGLSQRFEQKAGPRPLCHGCGKNIEYDERSLYHSYKGNNQKYAKNKAYHARIECLKNFSSEELSKFSTFLTGVI